MDDPGLANESLFLAALNASPNGVLILDAKQDVRYLNPRAEELCQTSQSDAYGKHWREILLPALAPEAPIVCDENGLPETRTYELRYRTPTDANDDDYLLITLTANALDAPVNGTLLSLQPGGTAADELQARLERSRRQLNTTYDRGQVGFWEWDAATRSLVESGYWVGKTANTATSTTVSDSTILSNTHPDDVDAVKEALISYFKGQRDYYEVEQRVRAIDGGYIHFLVRGQAAERDADGQILRMAGTYVDISALREQEAVLKFALESSEQGIWEWDLSNNEITEHGYWQPRLESYSLYSPINGASLAKHVHADDLLPLKAQVLRHLRAEVPTLEAELRLRRRDGSWGVFLIRGRALDRDTNGRVGKILGTYTDVSNIKAAERRLQVAVENGRQGLWEWQPDSDSVYFSREWYDMFGYPEGSITSAKNDFSLILDPDETKLGYDHLLGEIPDQGDHFEIELRIRHADGHYINVLSLGRVSDRGSDGRATRYIGSHLDITDLKTTEARLIESRQLLETVIDAIPLRLFWKDVNNLYLGCNRVFAHDAGAESPQDLIGKHVHEVPWPGPTEPLLKDDQQLLTHGEEKLIVQRQFKPVVGNEMWAEITKVPIRSPDNDILGILGIYDDVSDRIRRESQLETIADAFTRTPQSRLLDSLTEAASTLAGANYAYVALVDPSITNEAKVTACYPSDSELRDLTYAVERSPCALALEREEYYVSAGVAKQFPDDQILSYWDIEGYAGRRLTASDGRTIGLFCLLFSQPAPEHSRTRAVIDVFAARAIAELEREQTLGVLSASEERLNAAMTGGAQGVWEWHVESDKLTIFGQPFDDLGHDLPHQSIISGEDLFSAIHGDDHHHQRQAMQDYLIGKSSTYEFEGRLRHPDGSSRWTLIRGQSVARDDAGKVVKMIGTLTDISDQKRIQLELESSQHLLELVVNTMPQAIFWQDRDFRYLGCNQQFADLSRVDSPRAVIGRRDDSLWWKDKSEVYRQQDLELLEGIKSSHKSEVEIPYHDGSSGWYELIKVPMFAASGEIIGILGAIHNISVLKEAEESAQRLAQYDHLTNLPNRRLFTERLEAALAAAKRRNSTGALLFIDMDQFKQINDTLGHSVGDALLQAVAQRLSEVTRQDDMVARLGGDEFVVLLPEKAPDFEHCAHQAQMVADKIHRSLGAPFEFSGHQFHVTPTIGISLFPEGDKNAEDVLKEADTAMYSGKAAGRNVTRFFRREMEEATQHRLRIESDLREALKTNQFVLYFQPQIDRTGSIGGAEVLLRWDHPTRGAIPPSEFIPVAEDCGLIVELGNWVLEASFRAFHRWLEDGVELGDLSINVSSRQFRASDFVEHVEQVLGRYRIPPHRVVFEITESTVIEDVSATVEIMERLRRVGIRFAIDDFGVGYSSLSYLKRLPLDQIKIDRSFVADIGHDQNDEVICRTIIAMSQHLGLHTVAEGVETNDQHQFLSNLRCNAFQGYLFLPPSPEDEFLAHLATHQEM